MPTTLAQPSAFALEELDLLPRYMAALHDVQASRTHNRVGHSESIESAIERVVGEAPRLTAQQRERISALMSGVGR